MFAKVISGGQTGVDRAALDVALELGVECGGWCPPGRVAEDGRLPDSYPLTETPADTSPLAPEVPHGQRTEWNVRDADGTLILRAGPLDPGSTFTLRAARHYHKPSLCVELDSPSDPETVRAWAGRHHVRILNVAGPRESTCPGVYGRAACWLRQVLYPTPPSAETS